MDVFESATMRTLFGLMLPLALAGCTSTNPQAAFDDVTKQVAARSGYETRWMRDDARLRGDLLHDQGRGGHDLHRDPGWIGAFSSSPPHMGS